MTQVTFNESQEPQVAEVPYPKPMRHIITGTIYWWVSPTSGVRMTEKVSNAADTLANNQGFEDIHGELTVTIPYDFT